VLEGEKLPVIEALEERMKNNEKVAWTHYAALKLSSP
jgi:hypothetical protein